MFLSIITEQGLSPAQVAGVIFGVLLLVIAGVGVIVSYRIIYELQKRKGELNLQLIQQ